MENQTKDQETLRDLAIGVDVRQFPSEKFKIQDSRFSQVLFFNDTIIRAPDQFYKFYHATRNTRAKLVSSNKDIFIIWG